ncbi:MAG: family 43 glycosylhydrolase [Acidobacteriaceae bacterium]
MPYADRLETKPRYRAALFHLTCTVALVAMLVQIAPAQKLITPGYLFNSDPTCGQIGDTFYLFTTQDPFTVEFIRENAFYKGMYAFHEFTTTDFDHWVDHGSILTSRDVTWNTGGALWDGDAGIPANGRFYAYAPFRMNSASEANYGRFDIGVFTATNPAGPYHDAFGAPMKNFDGTPLEGLSPTVIRDDSGAPYLLWGSGDTAKHAVMLARLKPNMVELAEPPHHLSVQKKDACGNLEYFESPMLFKSGAKWYLTYVAYKDIKGPGCDAPGSYVEYAEANSMFGPFDAPARHLIYPAAGGVESVQQGVCQYKGKWYIAYHVPYEDLLPHNDHHRQVGVTALTILPDGSLRPIYPARDAGVGTPGVTHLTLDAYAPRREAAEFQVRRYAAGQKSLSGGYQMQMKDGSYLQFHDVDFGSGAAAFRVEISSENKTLRSTVLQVRLNNPAGKVIGTVKVDGGQSATVYRTYTVPVDAAAHGVQDLCLMAHGEDGDAHGNLFNITSFAFVKRQP